MANPTLVLAVDLGTSGPKVAVVSTRGEVLGWDFEEVPLVLLDGGGAEQDPDDWWTAVVTASRRLLAALSLPGERIGVVACTSQWSGTVPVDDRGRHLARAIIWMDSRGAPLVREITGGLPSISGYRADRLARWILLTGGAPGHAGKDPIAHILWLRRHRPEVYSSARWMLEPKDYLNARLTGLVAAGHDSIALHWVTDNRDVRRIDYDDELLRVSTLDPGRLPPLRSPIEMLGPILPEVAAELGVGGGAHVVMGTPDVHSAAIGSGGAVDFDAHLYLGTSSWLTCHVPFKKTDLVHGMASLPSALPGRYLVANEQETAGACLDWLVDNLRFAEGTGGAAYQELDRIAEAGPPGSGGVVFTPWLYGERTPVDDRTVRAGFFNQSLQTTREHLVRAVYEGVALNSRWLLTYVERFVRRRIDRVRLVGGGARSAVWCQIHADVLGRTVQQVRDPILVNLRGVAFLAGMGLGEVTVDEIPRLVELDGIFHPDPANRSLYDDRFDSFVDLYRANRKIYARMNAGDARS